MEEEKQMDLISNIYNEIESKREIVLQMKQNYYPQDSSNIVAVNINIFNDLLDEFDITISHSLQAIQTLQTQLLNLKEKYSQQNLFNQHCFIDDTDTISNAYNKSQVEDKSKLCYDYSQISNFNAYMVSDKYIKAAQDNHKEEEDVKEGSEDLKEDDNNDNNNNINIDNNNINNNNDNNNINNNIKDNKVELVVAKVNDIQYEKEIKKEDIINKKTNNEENIIKENLLANDNNIISKTYNPYKKIIPTIKNEDIYDQDTSNKRNNINSSKYTNNSIYDSDLSMKNNPSEYNQNSIYNTKPIKKSIRQIIQNTKKNKEDIILQKRDENREKIQKQKMKFLLEKISKVDTYRLYFGDKYGEGNYQSFLNKLNNNEITLSTLEDELLIIADLMANQINEGNTNSPTTSKNNWNTLNSDSKDVKKCNTKSYFNKPKLNYTKANNNNQYVEPIKFDNFLRTNDRNIKTKKKMNFSLSKK